MSSPFPLPILFTAWTWKDGAGIAGEVIRRAKLGAFRTVAVQLSQDTPTDSTDGGSTLDEVDVDYLHEAGLFVVGWDKTGAGTLPELHDLKLDGWLPQVEGPDQREALIALLGSGTAPKLPRALVTTYGGLDTPDDVHALVEAWGGMPFTFVECYAADDPVHADISRMLSQGYVYGFGPDSLRAILGTYRGETPANYTGLDAADYGGVYLEEPMNDAQLAALAPFAALTPQPTPTPTPEPAVTNDSTARKAQIEKIAEEWLSNFGPAPLSRLAVIDAIAKSSDADWNARRQDVVDALNGTTEALKSRLASAEAALDAAAQHNAALNAKIAAAKAALG